MPFTIGATASYDKGLVNARQNGVPMVKVGKGSHPNDPDYEGGWVWESFEAARAAAQEASAELGKPFSVYELEIPDRGVTYSYLGADNRHHLLADALVLRKVD